jgi:winged helix DNA-binding protein
MRTLTKRELNRALLARQLLLERGRMSLPKALERVGEIQAQYAPSMYIGLWSRLDGFERDALTRALERKSVVQGTLMRITIHLVSKRDYWPIAIGLRQARREQWLRARRGQANVRELEAAARRLRPRLAKEGVLRRADIDEIVGMGSMGTNGVGLWVDLVRVPPSGTWERRRADLYAAAEDWLGKPPADATVENGIELLVRRYLTAFGPATQNDIASWAGLPPKVVARTLERIKLRRFTSEDGAELVDLPRAPLPDPETPAPARLLPTWDATLLVHARRTGVLPEQHRSKVFTTKTPQSVSTFLVDGEVAGTWRYDKGKVKLEPFGKLTRAARRELDQEAERLAAFHA